MLGSSFLASGALLLGFEKFPWGALARTPVPQDSISDRLKSGKLSGTIAFSGEGRAPLGEPMGAELDGRLFTDLSTVTPEKSVTATEQFYIRTRVSNLLKGQKPWRIRVHGSGAAKPLDISADDLSRSAKPMGAHLMECAGNARPAHFGMMSVAEWSGVPVTDILEANKTGQNAGRILISGFDTYETKSASSVPGASWIFTSEELKRASAFLATEMNGAPLTKDHGAPVRLVVPGWYGCTCIKWVNEISFPSETANPTSQMQEYASRTMQSGMPKLVRDYKPAAIEQAAMPIRMEKWSVDEQLKYRVDGIAWGGSVPVKRLQIRFNPEEEYVDVDEFRQQSNDPWSFWSHLWTPKALGTYLIRLQIAEPAVVARRLDAGYYMRSAEITEI